MKKQTNSGKEYLNTVSEYTKFIEEHVGRLWSHWYGFLDEERGINTKSQTIIDILYGIVCQYKAYQNRFGGRVLRLKRQFISNDTFLNDININVVLTYDDRGESVQNSFIELDKGVRCTTNDVTNVLQLCGCTLVYEQSSPTATIDKQLFYQIMWHELLHAWRFYNIKLNYNSEMTEGERYANSKYQKAVSLLSKGNTHGMIRWISWYNYVSNKDEINAMVNEIMPLVERNPLLNNFTYRSYLPKLRLYKTVCNFIRLRDKLLDISKNAQTNDYADAVYAIRIFNGRRYQKYSDSRIIKSTIRNIEKTIAYSQKELYKAIDYCLGFYGRRYQHLPSGTNYDFCPDENDKSWNV